MICVWACAGKAWIVPKGSKTESPDAPKNRLQRSDSTDIAFSVRDAKRGNGWRIQVDYNLVNEMQIFNPTVAL
jgi:hypothetical protein